MRWSLFFKWFSPENDRRFGTHGSKGWSRGFDTARGWNTVEMKVRLGDKESCSRKRFSRRCSHLCGGKCWGMETGLIHEITHW
jgi:hypothetical protein